MAALDSDSNEDLISYGTGLEPLEEGAGPMAGGVSGAQAGNPARGRQRHLGQARSLWAQGTRWRGVCTALSRRVLGGREGRCGVGDAGMTRQLGYDGGRVARQYLAPRERLHPYLKVKETRPPLERSEEKHLI